MSCFCKLYVTSGSVYDIHYPNYYFQLPSTFYLTAKRLFRKRYTFTNNTNLNTLLYTLLLLLLLHYYIHVDVTPKLHQRFL